MNCLPKSVKNLIEELAKLPGIGPKSAQRLAIYLLHSPASRLTSLGEAILKLKDNISFCENCWNITETNPCLICSDSSRDKSMICVVEQILDVVALEKTLEFKGVYHVLHGALSPIDAIGPDQLKIEALFRRVQKGMKAVVNDEGKRVENVGGDADGQIERGHNGYETKITEVILATNPSLEGEATALYIQKHLRGFDVKITRIARGLPVGGDLEYADEVTLSRALKGRGEF